MIAPYYDHKGIQIYNADFREIISDLNFDVIVADAPYGIGVEYGSFFDCEGNVESLARSLEGHLQKKRGAIFCGVPQQWLWPRPKWVLCWSIYPATNEFSPWGFSQWQPILVYGADPYLANKLGPRPTVFCSITPPDRNGNDHPCPKPLDVISWTIQRVSIDPEEILLDCFLGSGTTLRAAKDLNRRAIGIELEERYCEIAARRLEQEVFNLL